MKSGGIQQGSTDGTQQFTPLDFTVNLPEILPALPGIVKGLKTVLLWGRLGSLCATDGDGVCPDNASRAFGY